MKKSYFKKIYIILSIFFILIIIVTTVFFLFKRYYSTYPWYNDRFVIGNTAENIEAKYGKFDRISYPLPDSEYFMLGEYCVKKGVDDFDWYLGHGKAPIDIYYRVCFDENGIARKVTIHKVA